MRICCHTLLLPQIPGGFGLGLGSGLGLDLGGGGFGGGFGGGGLKLDLDVVGGHFNDADDGKGGMFSGFAADLCYPPFWGFDIIPGTACRRISQSDFPLWLAWNWLGQVPVEGCSWIWEGWVVPPVSVVVCVRCHLRTVPCASLELGIAHDRIQCEVVLATVLSRCVCWSLSAMSHEMCQALVGRTH